MSSLMHYLIVSQHVKIIYCLRLDSIKALCTRIHK